MHRFFREMIRIRLAVSLCSLIALAALAQPRPTAEPPPAQDWRATNVAEGIDRPWGLAWLPDGRPLITGKEGTLHVLDGNRFKSIPMEGLPDVFTEGQGGLMDIALHPDFKENRRVYMTLSTGTEQQNRTALVRGVFDGERLRDIETLFQAQPDKSNGEHFGSRILWLPDGTMLVSIGDGGNPPQRVGDMLAREQAQNLGSHHGSILRLMDDGKPAPKNPLAFRKGAEPEIWTYGHRNVQGMARDPESGRIWANEHGPKGGDELNLIKAGENYGWPLVTLGRDYRIGDPIGKQSAPGMANPKVVWIPTHAPSGLAFYSGDRFPEWRGSLFSGGLASEDIRRIKLDGKGNVTGQEQLDIGARIRDVEQGPDGYLYALTDEQNGRLLRIERK
jgi:glucose/arabinose dehydrogenase